MTPGPKDLLPQPPWEGPPIPGFMATRPTGTCYEDAWRFILKEEEGELVHGTAISFGHAWVELPLGYIWEPYSKAYFTKEGFQALFDPVEEHRYTLEEALVMAVRSSNFGPWTSKERSRWIGR